MEVLLTLYSLAPLIFKILSLSLVYYDLCADIFLAVMIRFRSLELLVAVTLYFVLEVFYRCCRETKPLLDIRNHRVGCSLRSKPPRSA